MKFISGLANCHLPGLYSLVISERESPAVGMKRVFYTGPNCQMGLWDRDAGDFVLKPHNHRQSIRLTRLFGNPANWTFRGLAQGEPRESAYLMYRYRFGSALLNQEFTVKQEGCLRMVSECQPITAAAPLTLHWSEVHTVTASRSSAWLVEELELAPEGQELCWAVSPQLQLDSAGLY